ncbi:hypothetical protein HYS94_01160 [Candidatus Daviesbacteria bacterium]|nr:hypothetical protein [Candidatus Daviesbacteria bacterium]
MLNRRAQILFDKELWNQITKLAQAEKTSIGDFVRKTLRDRVAEEKRLEKRRRAIDATLLGRLISKDKIDYKELINYGRKW